MREPTILRPRVAPDPDTARRLAELQKQISPPPGASLHRDRVQPRIQDSWLERPLSMLLRRQAG